MPRGFEALYHMAYESKPPLAGIVADPHRLDSEAYYGFGQVGTKLNGARPAVSTDPDYWPGEWYWACVPRADERSAGRVRRPVPAPARRSRPERCTTAASSTPHLFRSEAGCAPVR